MTRPGGRTDESDERGATTEARTAQLRTFLVACAFTWFLVSARNLYLDRPRVGTVGAVACAFSVLAWILAGRVSSERGLKAIGHVSLAGTTFALLCGSIANGGMLTTLFLLGIVPPVAAYVLSTRAAMTWTALVFAGAGGVVLLGRAVPLPIEYRQGLWELVFGHYMALFAGLLLLAVASRRTTDAQIAKANLSEATVRKQAEELVLARDVALEAGRVKSAFLANMSHELRTPLNAVIGMASVLDDADLSEEQRECIATIRTSGETLLALISDILDFSKIEAGKVELEDAPVEVLHCVEDALDLVAPSAARKGLELTFEIGGDVPTWISTDRARLQQVLLNLLSNAVKFTPSGDIAVTVSARAQPDERFEVQFQVKDDGVGIAPQKLGRLFQTFSQVDASTTREYGGAGLGLAISKALVGLLGGTLGVESAPGRGSTFTFTVRARAAVAPAPGVRQRQESLSDVREQRVLLVGAHARVRETVARQLARDGARVTAIASLDDDAMSGAWDVAVVDAGAAGEGDFAVAVALQKRFPQRPLAVLVPFGRHDAAPLELARRHSVVMVTKPVKPARLRKALLSRGGRREDPASRVSLAVGARISFTPAALRILVVEDNLVNQRVQRRLLEQLGHQVDVVSDGLEALETVRRRGFDAIFLDLQMPGLDGLETARRLVAEWPAPARGQIIALTANASPEDRAACLAAGMDDYLSKPVRLSDLEAVLRRVQPSPRTTGDGAGASGEVPALDPAVIASLVSLEVGNPEPLLAPLVDLFFSDAPTRLAALADALGRADAPGVDLQAHSLKGSAGTLGMARVGSLAAEIEFAAKAGQLAELGPRVEKLRAAIASVEPELRGIVAQQATTAARVGAR